MSADSPPYALRRPALANFTRYKKLFLQGAGHSVTRALQYELLGAKVFSGQILDFGGGENAKYRALLPKTACDSINIDPAIKPTWTVSIGAPFPCPQNHYDFVVSLNTIEHIFDAKFVLSEIHAALKPGGAFVCSIPFLYPVHGHPDDYFRPTASWWHAALSELGFEDIHITPLIWGPFSTGAICSGLPGPFKGARKHAALLLDLLYARLRFGRRKPEKEPQDLYNHALGYFIEARK